MQPLYMINFRISEPDSVVVHVRTRGGKKVRGGQHLFSCRDRSAEGVTPHLRHRPGSSRPDIEGGTVCGTCCEFYSQVVPHAYEEVRTHSQIVHGQAFPCVRTVQFRICRDVWNWYHSTLSVSMPQLRDVVSFTGLCRCQVIRSGDTVSADGQSSLHNLPALCEPHLSISAQSVSQ